jgi:dTDP-4-dehydrorhamnose reductase
LEVAHLRTVVFGANGLLGSALMSHLSDAVGTYHNSKDNLIDGRCYDYLDVTDHKKVGEFFSKHKPQRVFIACANPDVNGCEKLETDKVNVTGISRLITFAGELDAQVIFFSSSYVFEGTNQTPYKPRDETFPLNRYGRQKEVIERLMTSRPGLQYLIIRTVGVFGKEGTSKNFVDQVRRAVKENRRICVPSDQTMNPIWSMDLAKTSIHLANRYGGDIFHVAGNKCVSKYEWAIDIARLLGCKKPHELIIGVKTENMQTNNPDVPLALRPKNGCLDCGDLVARALTIPNLEKGLEKYLGAKNDKRRNS